MVGSNHHRVVRSGALRIVSVVWLAGAGGLVACGSSDTTVSPNAGGASAAGGSFTAGSSNAAGSANAAGAPTPSNGGAGSPASGGQGALIDGGGAPSTGGGAPNTGGGAPNAGGAPASGGAVGAGGNGTAGMTQNVGGTVGSGGASQGAACDSYGAGNTPCVAAHSTVRALFGSYDGKLYQVRRASDKTTKDIAVLSPGGYANAAAQDTFCAGTTCTISLIYDQTSQANHLTVTPPGGWLANGGTEANATAAKITISGHTAYGVYTTGSFDEAVGGVGYRNNKTKGIATGDQPEGIYMVASGKHYNQWCCFDYGNAETNNKDNGPGTMETLYFGTSTQWGRGSGSGPWVMADLEDGVFAGGSFAAP